MLFSRINLIQNIGFSALHDIVDISKSKFGFDHPELGDVSAGV